MELLKKAIESFGYDSSADILDSFEKYMHLVLEWNEKVNLTAITDRDEFITRHFIDSLCCLPHEEYRSSKNVIDVGTGAGFPGIPLAIMSPDKEFLLIDSLNKRIKIINEIISAIGLKNVTAIHGRAEELARNKEYREQFDICVSRAVSRMSVLSEYCLPFVKKGGWLAAYKGSDIEQELEDAHSALGKLGGKVISIKETDMMQFGISHHIVYIQKTMNTPKLYPRKAGMPERKPL
jgi:16S rRNA (guanine527-N7)-methyltransferase